MVIDKLENFGKYRHLIKDGDAVADFLERRPEITGPVAVGGYEMAPFGYTPEPASRKRWETHRHHLDIHIPLVGTEYLCWVRREELQHSVEVVEDPDTEFFDDDAKGMRLYIKPGYFAILMPEDAHKPGVTAEGATKGVRTGFKCVWE
ncbi:MAG: YhcH/YjgK/YiaL family protein [Lachnospiraceae bacterium]|jgi:YhcH/YjgK/YiaL family protein|nr:YhcH/YjgK/YiaL family protein [Lachnospiraceae bacterium]